MYYYKDMSSENIRPQHTNELANINELTELQLRKINKYWKIIQNYEEKLNNFDYFKYRTYDEYFDDLETIQNCIDYNGKIKSRKLFIEEKIRYFWSEYINYLSSIGYELNNREYSEPLFNLLNQGICIYKNN